MFTVINTCTRDIPFRTRANKERTDNALEVIMKHAGKLLLSKWKRQALFGTARKRKGPGKGRTLTSLKHKEHLVDLRRFREED